MFCIHYLDFRQNRYDRCTNAQQHVDADEDFVLSAAARVSVIHIEQDQRHQRQSVVDGCGREKSYRW